MDGPDVLTATAMDGIKEGQLVKLIAVPLYKDETPSGVAVNTGEAGEPIGVIGRTPLEGVKGTIAVNLDE